MEYLERIGVALAVGLLIGIERGWRDRGSAEGARVAGVRTFTLMGLLGALWGVLGDELGPIVLGFSFLAFSALIIVGHLLDVRHNQDYGITTAVASLVTFALGVVAAQGYLTLAAAGGVATATLLSLKPFLHRWLRTLQQYELFAAFKLLLISVVMLPVLPNTGYGPWQELNPREIWWFVVLISSISFVGYFAVKFAGARLGITLTGLFGGLASSTAVALTFSRLARLNPSVQTLLSAGIIVAAGTMFPRILLEVAVVNNKLVPVLAGPLLLMALICYLAIPLLLHHAERSPLDSTIKLHDPFELLPALKFALFLVAIMIAAHSLQKWWGESGLYVLAAGAGITDVDAITLTMARRSRDTLDIQLAANAILLAATVNTLIKGGIVLYLARGMAKAVLGTFLLALCTGALFWWVG